MEQQQRNNEIRDEVRKEFQLDRMIIFSDAVFAIAMTLMAMDIKLPKTEGGITSELLPKAMLQLLPVVISYTVSFVFIGAIWYEHLKIFSLLKDYDKGLVFRNLLLLFFIGFFPFCSSLITQEQGGMIAFLLYFLIIMLCMSAQYLLYHYIVITKPEIALKINRSFHLLELKKRRISLIGLLIAALLAIITYALSSSSVVKALSTMWVVVYAIAYAIWAKKLKPDPGLTHEGEPENPVEENAL